jgi:hypothetical protein
MGIDRQYGLPPKPRARVGLDSPKAHGDPHLYYLEVRVDGYCVWSKAFRHSMVKPRHWRKAIRIGKRWERELQGTVPSV